MTLCVKLYSSNASINWMFVEGHLLHSKVSTQVFKPNAPFRAYYTIGWGEYHSLTATVSGGIRYSSGSLRSDPIPQPFRETELEQPYFSLLIGRVQRPSSCAAFHLPGPDEVAAVLSVP